MFDFPVPPTTSPPNYTSSKLTDPALVHPVFITSGLCLDDRHSALPDIEYPVERLNPVCIGYYNHFEYEAAMDSIRAAEAIVEVYTEL